MVTRRVRTEQGIGIYDIVPDKGAESRHLYEAFYGDSRVATCMFSYRHRHTYYDLSRTQCGQQTFKWRQIHKGGYWWGSRVYDKHSTELRYLFGTYHPTAEQ